MIKVREGQSIQAAVDKADPGDTVKVARGTYEGTVEIKTDEITLKGAGDDETLIKPGASSTPGFCDGAGICVADVDASDPNGLPVIKNHVEGVEVKDLQVQGFAFTGVLFFGTRDQEVNDVLADGNGEYGIAAFETTGGRYWDNETVGSGEAGLYIGDSEDADAVVRDNVATDNGIGFFIRDAAHGLIEDNQATDNCAGFLVLDTPDDPAAPRPNHDWLIRDNTVNHNNKACSGEEGNFSGIGIAISGAHRIKVVDNTANDNQPGGPSDAGSAGIAVLTEGGPTATDNVIKDNTALGNALDLFWYQQGTNRFEDNRCETSDPAGLCENGDEHGDDDGDDHHGGAGDGDHGDKGHHKAGKHKKHHKHHKHKHKRHDD